MIAFAGGPANATILFSPTQSPQPDEENLDFTASDENPALTQTGTGHTTGVTAIFTTSFTAGAGSLGGSGTGQNIVANGIGQADIVCAPGAAPCVNNGGGDRASELTSLQITPEPGFGWHDFIGNPTHGVGVMNVFVQDNLGNNFSFDLSQGQEFFTLTTADNEAITLIQLTQKTTDLGNPFGWADFAQPRVSGVCVLGTATCEPVSTPEPSALAVLGLGLLGLGVVGLRRRR